MGVTWSWSPLGGPKTNGGAASDETKHLKAPRFPLSVLQSSQIAQREGFIFSWGASLVSAFTLALYKTHGREVFPFPFSLGGLLSDEEYTDEFG